MPTTLNTPTADATMPGRCMPRCRLIMGIAGIVLGLTCMGATAAVVAAHDNATPVAQQTRGTMAIAAGEQADHESGQSGSQVDEAGHDKAGHDKSAHPAQSESEDLPDGNAAISQLLRLWGVFGDQVTADCEQLHIGNLRCLSAYGSIETIRHFDRPAILILKRDGQDQRVLLSQIGEDSVTLTGAEDARRVSIESLRKAWTGQFELIWRSEAESVLIGAGMRGSAVLWLRQQLQKATGDKLDAPETAPPFFDDTLTSEVRQFQRKHDLIPDGIAGPRTQIILNGSVDDAPGIPTLQPDEEKEH